MSTPNVPSQSQNDARYATPASVTSAIGAQAVTDAGQYATKSTLNNKASGSNLISGHETIDRMYVYHQDVGPMNSGDLQLTYFSGRVNASPTGVRILSGAGSASGATLIRIGLYAENGNGDLTLVTATASDTTLFSSSGTTYIKSFISAGTIVNLSRYAVGVLVVATTTPLYWGTGVSSAIASEYGQTPRISGVVFGQSDLPASILNGSINNTHRRIYSVIF